MGAPAVDSDLPHWREEIFLDPQTSGGLLASVAAEQAEEALSALHQAGVAQARRIGTVEPYDGRHFLVFA